MSRDSRATGYAWPPAAGIVLAGGRSRRMGRDKALLRVGDGEGETLLERALRLLSGLAHPCWVSCAGGRAYEGYACLADEAPNQGPAAGILAGLKAARAAGCAQALMLACDMPFMKLPLLRRLLAAGIRADTPHLVALYVTPPDSRPQPLAALYRVEAIPLFEAALGRGERRVSAIVPPRLQLRIACAPADARAFFNCNTPDDLQAARGVASPE